MVILTPKQKIYLFGNGYVQAAKQYMTEMLMQRKISFQKDSNFYPNKRIVGTVQPELTPVELVGYEDDEAGSPLALDNG